MTDDADPEANDADADADADTDRETRATVRTSHDRPAVVAAALRPDNTAEIDTRVEDGRVVTRVERDRASGLRSTVDDYLVNLDVAERTVRKATEHDTRQ